MFVAFLMYREIGLTCLVLIFVNLIYRMNGWVLRALFTFLYLVALFSLDLLIHFYHVLTYINWSYFATLLLDFLYVGVSFGITFFCVRLKGKEALDGNHL